jgi:hypothetical protein
MVENNIATILLNCSPSVCSPCGSFVADFILPHIKLILHGLGSRTRDWPACVAPAKNNYTCLFIVKRDKRVRNAGRCAGCFSDAGQPHA